MSFNPPTEHLGARHGRRHGLLAGLASVLLLAAGLSAPARADQGMQGTQMAMQPATRHAAHFMLGADVSTLEEVERHGGRFATPSGQPASALQLLRAAGFNWARLRLWHTPVNAGDVFEGNRRVSRAGEPVGGGNNGLALTLRLAQRAKAQGLKLLLDLHYSDFWTDPGQQAKPAAWSGLQGEALQQAVRAYTAEVLRALHAADASPDMVQVGNEVNGGMLWPDGKTWQQTPGEVIGGTAAFHALLKAGIAGVRDTDALRGGAPLPVMLHLAKGGDNALFRRVFDGFVADGVAFDAIGLSWYPYFHGPIAGLRANLADLSARYGKPLVVVETAYAWTPDNPGGHPPVLDRERIAASGYPATPQGQIQMLSEVVEAVAAVPQGLGVFYWEPAWLAVDGAGWRSGDGNGWANQTLFDERGRALPSLGAMRAAAPWAPRAARP